MERVLPGQRLCHRVRSLLRDDRLALPAVTLSFAAFMLVNAVLFHILPVLLTRIFPPGLFTAILLFLPVGIWVHYSAWQDGALSTGAAVISGVLGFVLMRFPIVLQKTKRLPFFRQDGGA